MTELIIITQLIEILEDDIKTNGTRPLTNEDLLNYIQAYQSMIL